VRQGDTGSGRPCRLDGTTIPADRSTDKTRSLARSVARLPQDEEIAIRELVGQRTNERENATVGRVATVYVPCRSSA